MSKSNPTAREVFVFRPSLSEADQLVFEENLFKRLRMVNGLSKKTKARRLDDVNRIIIEKIEGRWSGKTLNVLDVAISSGVSTAEFAEALRGKGFNFKILGTDFSVEAFLLSYGSSFHVLCNGRGKALQFEIFGFPVSNYVGTGITFVRRFVPVFFCRALFQLLKLAPLTARKRQPIRLLTDACQRHPAITIVEEDLLQTPRDAASYDVIRAANILNPDIFSREQLDVAIDNLRRRLKMGGILFVVRTLDDGANHGGCYELQFDGSFHRLGQVGCGSDVDLLVVAEAKGKQWALNR